MSGDSTAGTPVRSPGSDVSPRSQPTPKPNKDYFTIKERKGSQSGNHAESTPAQTGIGAAVYVVGGNERATLPAGAIPMSKGKEKEVIDNRSDASASTPGDSAPSPSSSGPPSRKTSISSVTFRQPRNPALPQGAKKPHGGSRIREASPPPTRFEKHVGFDNIPLGEPTDYNPISLTLNVRHAGFQFNPRGRTFMVGVDDNSYSDHALRWLLDELVDDGDQIVCVRVIETQTRVSDREYREEANALMAKIQSKNTQNHAINLVLEYAVGKLHNTFQSLIKIHQPSMLIVGTKGRSLEGMQGIFANRNSFSKYCLQYSPVPVVVVRPTEKREKKKTKRAKDPSRNTYMHMLKGQKHEADADNNSVYELEPKITADEEAHRVAVAVGLPASYDPTIKPIDPAAVLAGRAAVHRKGSSQADVLSTEQVALAASGRVPADTKSPDSEGDESEYEEEFIVESGEQILRKERLHKMESNEGAALKTIRKEDEEDEESEDEAKDDAKDKGKGTGSGGAS